MTDTEWKQKHANEAEKVLDSPFVQDVMAEFADNMHFELKGLPRYGLMKVVCYAAQVARAQALGFDPELLRATPAESNSRLLKVAAQAVMLGVPVHMIETTEESSDG